LAAYRLTEPVRVAALSINARFVDNFATAPDGTILASGDWTGTVNRWDLTDPARPVPLAPRRTPFGRAFATAFSHDGRLLAASSLTGVSVWYTGDDPDTEPIANLERDTLPGADPSARLPSGRTRSRLRRHLRRSGVLGPCGVPEVGHLR
jgi:hypothetical protein